MKRKRNYSAVDVEQFELKTILPLVPVGCIVAIDVAKTKFVAAVATTTGEVLKLVKFEHPRQTPLFLRQVNELREAGREPVVVMESTGTYGDAIRYQLHRLGAPVHMMPPKHTHDFAEVLDGVPSMHDPKAAVVLAKLQAIKPARAWKPVSEERANLRAWLDQRNPVVRTLGLYHGHLEAMLARHWPEFGTLIDVHHQRSWFALLKTLPGPEAVSAAREAATETLHNASRGHFGREHIQKIVDSASRTMGVPMTSGEKEKLRTLAEQIETLTRRIDVVDSTLAELVEADDVLSRLATVVGPACTAAIASLIGSPLDFTSAPALEKAMGLNLKEHSSGNSMGRMSITKRGPPLVRHMLFLAALRFVKDDPVAVAWYRARKGYKAGLKLKSIVAVMRKLARAVWHVARGEAFDAAKLFDTRRLELTTSTPTRAKILAKPFTSATQKTAARSTQEPCERGAAIA